MCLKAAPAPPDRRSATSRKGKQNPRLIGLTRGIEIPSVDKRYSLQKPKRLCERRDIDAVFNQANAIRHPAMILLAKANGLHYPRLAIIVAKKNIKKANARNRIKRLIRESFRLQQHQLAGHDFVIIVKI